VTVVIMIPLATILMMTATRRAMEKLQDKLLKMFGRELDYGEFLELVGSNVDGGGKIQVSVSLVCVRVRVRVQARAPDYPVHATCAHTCITLGSLCFYDDPVDTC